MGIPKSKGNAKLSCRLNLYPPNVWPDDQSQPTFMKIYILQDGQKSGPFTMDELREKIYSGELPRSIQGSIDGETAWLPLDAFFSRDQPSAPPVVRPPLQTP